MELNYSLGTFQKPVLLGVSVLYGASMIFIVCRLQLVHLPT